MEKFLVLIGATLLIGFIAWWFSGKHRNNKTEATVLRSNKQEVVVVVNGGYTPNTVVLKQGVPASIVFDRKDPSGCLSHVMFPDFGINEEQTRRTLCGSKVMPHSSWTSRITAACSDSSAPTTPPGKSGEYDFSGYLRCLPRVKTNPLF